MTEEWSYDAGRDAYFAGTSRCGEIPFYEDYEDECLWVDGWDDAKRNIPIDGPPNLVKEK